LIGNGVVAHGIMKKKMRRHTTKTLGVCPIYRKKLLVLAE